MSARATERGHGSHDIDGPMNLVMPGRLGLRPRRRGGDATTNLHELTESLS